ncbi:MAG TPA: GNAT family N-acetyltransferase [bacterium]|nr:GNAT family N-acetyltransferase [bacterium]HOC24237.1 GNAT family N-acetyltransferase [bacterium]HOH06007.1 GNAT family N-acetyltransferase [bacterium]HPG82002.1 GNAT family N-acetyltransferase [bacterium]
MIRAMQPQDKEEVIRLLQATGMFTAEEVVVAEELVDLYLNLPGQKDYIVDVLEEDSGRVVGFATWGPTPLTDGTFDLYWIAVSPEAQGKGYGKMLLRQVENKIEEEKGRVLIIETSSQPRYESTRQFYLKQHYQEVARIADFYRANDDRIIYAKYFS